MNLAERTQLILADMERRYGHNFLAEPVQQANGSAEFIPLWNAYRERDAVSLLRALDKLCADYWTPVAQGEAEYAEDTEANEERYRRTA